MKQVWKYQFPVDSYQVWIEMPEGSEIVSVHEQDAQVCLWAIGDSKGKKINRNFEIFGTGHDIKDAGLTYIGTAFMKTGLVWHVFEEFELDM